MTAHWSDLPFLALDTETTGVDVFTDRIVQIAAARIELDGTVTETFTAVIDPGVDIPAGAAAVHGITTERAKAEGDQPAEALGGVADVIRSFIDQHNGAAALVMYNARFDWPLLLAECERHGVDLPVTAGILDPYLIDRLLDKYRKGKRQLILVAQHYGVELSTQDAHGALADCIAAGQVMRRIVTAFPQVRRHTLATMWLRQVIGHEQDRQGFEAYMRKSVDPNFRAVGGWPIPVAAEQAS